MNIQILVDNPQSWYIKFACELNCQLTEKGHFSQLISEHNQLVPSDVLFILSCEKIVKKVHRELNKLNLVVHASDLPRGRGWSPLTWQILENKSSIPVSMIKAEDEVDSGDIMLKDFITLEGHELIDEIREKLGHKINMMCLNFIESWKSIIPQPQIGESSYYPKRTKKDSCLDLNKSIKEQINLFRIADNERYPLTFSYLDHEYKIIIHKIDQKQVPI